MALPVALHLRGQGISPATARPGRPVLFVGLDGADWSLLDRYLADGRMPHLAGLLRDGRAGALTTLHPSLSPLLWTTMMTGAEPLEHGILDFTRLNPRTGAREPITSDERLVPAVWNMASASGMKVGVFGLWATYPAEEVRGLLVSDRLLSLPPGQVAPPGVIHPATEEVWARRIMARVEHDTDYAALRDYLPWLQEEEYRRVATRPDPFAHPVSALRRILAETRAQNALAMEWMARERPDLAIVYLQGTDTIGHLFAPYAPPRRAGIAATDVERYGGVPALYFAEIDRLLGGYREMAAARGAVLVLGSDHGFHWGDGRPARASGVEAATAGTWHREEGIYLLWGPGIEPAAGRSGAGSIRQICPTLLALLGLPADERAATGPLPGVRAADGRRVDYRAAYRPRRVAPGGEAGAAGPPEKPDPGPDQEALARLRSLGYLGGGEAAGAPADGAGVDDVAGRRSTRTAGSFNTEGLIRREQGQSAEAIAAFEQAIRLDPGHASSLWNLSDLLFVEGRDAGRADDLLLRAVEKGLPDGPARVAGRAIEYRRAGELDLGLRLLDRALSIVSGDPDLWLLRGRCRIESGDCAGALADFRRAAVLDPGSALAYASSGLARLCLNDRRAALGDFRRSLEIDPDQPELRKQLEP